MCILVATRETSFVHAISAAGVMYTLTRNCSLGDLDNCGCDNSRNGKIGKNNYKYNIIHYLYTYSSIQHLHICSFYHFDQSNDLAIVCGSETHIG